MKEEFVEKMLITTLRFWIKKVKRGDCTREQELAILNAIDENSRTDATIGELADFYGKSKDAVNSVIKRRYIGKPKRNVVPYSFSKFRDAAPDDWHADTEESGS